MGLVDLHNHVLYGVDDGAAHEREALAMARELVAAGFTDVVATPHSMPQLDPDPALVAQRRAELQQALHRDGVPLRLHPGRENHLTADFVERAEKGDARPLGRGPWVLVELPFATPVPGLREVLFRLQLKGLRVLFAHPERCAHFVSNLEATRQVHDAGGRYQIEIGSVDGRYGSAAKKFARTLLDEGLASVAATDAHDEAGTRAAVASLKTLRKIAGEEGCARLVEHNPAAILRGEALGG